MNIGLTQRIFIHNNVTYDCLEHGWRQLLDSHTLLPIANDPEQNLAHLVESLDLVVFTGGDASPKRLLTEVRLITECYKQNKPILGVCHVAFFINEMEQGTNEPCNGHHNTDHSIIMHDKEYTVNSYHTNKITSVGKDFDVVATTKDGDIEAFRHRTKTVWGVVWHPERMKETVLPKELQKLLKKI